MMRDLKIPPPVWMGEKVTATEAIHQAAGDLMNDEPVPQLASASSTRRSPSTRQGRGDHGAIADRLGVTADHVRERRRGLGAMHDWGDGSRKRATTRAAATTWSRAWRSSRSAAPWSSAPARCALQRHDRLRRHPPELPDGADDPAVRAIVLDIDSPGGEVAGCFDLVDTIYAARGVKPIGRSCRERLFRRLRPRHGRDPGRLYVPRTGGTGSVGVIYIHVSYQGALEKAGVEVTLITKGDLKGEGNEFQNLSAGAFKRLKADVEGRRALRRHRRPQPRPEGPPSVFDTQAGTFLGGRRRRRVRRRRSWPRTKRSAPCSPSSADPEGSRPPNPKDPDPCELPCSAARAVRPPRRPGPPRPPRRRRRRHDDKKDARARAPMMATTRTTAQGQEVPRRRRRRPTIRRTQGFARRRW
jgi:hypothetical protein